MKSDYVELLTQEIRKRHPRTKFVAGQTYIPATTKYYTEKEILALVETALDFEITMGRTTVDFEKQMAKYLGTRFGIMTNSGSSANLLAITALTSPLLKDRKLNPGDEVITVAAGFPTTVNPIIQNGLIPVFVDVTIGSYNPTPYMVEAAITEKTKAIFIAHTLGNPYDAVEIKEIAKKYKLWFVEDCADALGSKLDGQKVGTFGSISTTSFYPAHHMTTGEGGMVFTDDPLLAKIIKSFRDWGRDCWCLPGVENTCGKRFGWCGVGELPDGYDHKYIYSHIGYNLKPTDLQAAIGKVQLHRLEEFEEDRKANWSYLRKGMETGGMEKYFILPTFMSNAQPSWFGFILTVRTDAGFTRNELAQYLESRKIGSRNLFAGNLLRQPAYQGIKHRLGDTVSKLAHTDAIAERAIWVACHPSLTKSMLDYMIKEICEFAVGNKNEN